MDQIKRITQMENALDRCSEAVAALDAALEHYEAAQKALRELAAYYESPLWMQDHDDDTDGKLPADLKRGVLTEDAVYDLLTDEARLREQMQALCKGTE